MTINFPCKECGWNILTQLPEPYSHVAECNNCGHPNDMPDKEILDHDPDLGWPIEEQ